MKEDEVLKKYFKDRPCCPFCSSQNTRIVSTNKIDYDTIYTRFSKNLPEELARNTVITWSECDTCHFIFQKNILKDEYLQLLYDLWIDMKHSLNKKEDPYRQQTKYKKSFGRRMGLFETHFLSNPEVEMPPPTSPEYCLDHAGGWGHFAKFAQDSNSRFTWECTELSEVKRDWGKQAFNIDFYESLETVPEARKYTLINSDQAFEHIEFPGLFLKQSVSLIGKSGCLLVGCPVVKKDLVDKELKNYTGAPTPLGPACTEYEHINIITDEFLNNLSNFVNKTSKIDCEIVPFIDTEPVGFVLVKNQK